MLQTNKEVALVSKNMELSQHSIVNVKSNLRSKIIYVAILGLAKK